MFTSWGHNSTHVERDFKNRLLRRRYVTHLGGGIAVGSCIIIDEDRYSTYSSLLLKYYLAEGVTNKHKVLLASANQPPSQILQVKELNSSFYLICLSY